MTRRRFRHFLRAFLKPLVLVAAVIYFLIDLVLLAALRPLLKRFSHLRLFRLIARWVASLSPYATLGIFLIPVILFEPAKPLAGYLIATGHFFYGALIIALAEIVKIVVLERLFHIAKPKLMTIGPFAATYTYVMEWWRWIRTLPPWAAVERAAADVFRSMKQFSRRTRREFRML